MRKYIFATLTIFACSLSFSAEAALSFKASQDLYSHNETNSLHITADEARVLWALNQQEASGRQHVRPRHEPGFYRRYLKDNSLFKAAEDKYGAQAISSSYGPWQIMYTTAVQYGYSGAPEDLSHPATSLPFVLKYIRRLESRFDQNLENVISAYNAGPGGVGTNPYYTTRVLSFLKKAPESWTVFGATA
ncbi:MAG: hypothetical protein ACI9CF_001144 [Candidatus Omnitrophota bacterium]|jgi:hypothetical protein